MSEAEQDRDAGVIADRDWWLQFEPFVAGRLGGFSYRYSAIFYRDVGDSISLDLDAARALLSALATARQDGLDAAIAIAARVANELTASGTGNQHTERAKGAWRVHTALRGGG